MANIESLNQLLESIKAGTYTTELGVLVFSTEKNYSCSIALYVSQAYYGSLDAAKSLHETLLPDWIWDVTNDHAFVTNSINGTQFAPDDYMENPARAWLIAIIKALMEKLKWKNLNGL